MKGEGLVEITNPSEILISERDDNPSGSCVVASMEGTRPMLIELQALTTLSVFGIPKRTANGLDYNRLAVLIAVLEKRANMNIGGQDIYVNVVSRNKTKRTIYRLRHYMCMCFKLQKYSNCKRHCHNGRSRVNRRSKKNKHDRKTFKRSRKIRF